MPDSPGDRRARVTLGQAFGLGLAVLGVLLLGLFSLVMDRSRASLVKSAANLAQVRSGNVAARVEAFLREAEQAALSLQNQVRHGSCDAQDPAAVEAHLFAHLLDNRELAEATFTHARLLGFDGEGHAQLAREGRWQVSVYRASADADSAIHTRFVDSRSGKLVARLRQRAPGATLLGAGFRAQPGTPPDPLEHPTFWRPLEVQRQPDGPGQPPAFTWTDLSHSELDAQLPEASRRVVLTVMKVVRGRDGQVAGVVRVGRLERQIDAEVRAAGAFLCDEQARLLTRLRDGDRLEDVDGDLRVTPLRTPVEVREALALPGLGALRGETGHVSLDWPFHVGGRAYLAHFETLRGTQGWRVGVVQAEDALPGFAALQVVRRRLLEGSLVLIVAILAGGALMVRAVRQGLAHVTDSAARLRDFDFSPQPARAPFRDLQEAERSLELAKTAMRAMGKYVPVGLVRELYRTGQEPTLGGELRDVSLMFTDLEGFTSLAESVGPSELALLLGRYLEVMTAAIHATSGIVDKYIGDAVMALWNAPVALDAHPRAACAAALGCREAARRLFASEAWAGRPPLVTRFGLHRATVMVGHFGAPERLSYTALGDGVNLAARLEGLNKQYGTHVMVSEDVRRSVGDSFTFRLLDRVAVKGKHQGVEVYELLGEAALGRSPRIEAYERALAAYWARDFSSALAIAAGQTDDAPSRVLAGRCRAFLDTPPERDWDGTFRATSK